ncbi:h-SHIPPO, putative [Trichomonas vaginalis G3]|uniref:H-SHIPPO, putative n=1 Tax=Trichomonas vaginalis (strain ATCC PRA-98 / G3) TaxID=412133 RepID=A2FIL4_TRIV3|nr:sperm-tail PG-rich repeat family [Trichomonas vaginalis G3]EAX95263.1 h-SHIPPO, putative [Trichomonas vaginalis G3]KAI5531907.1 sperm-tail PG-rich repeat family [Trichomonas vaginalis G3]|eukprot:XP_001308193.1 h-SHIPPO [Trichomonas vaginalis G3]
MRSRPRDSTADVTPGVNYCPPDFGKDTPGAHITGRYEKRLGNDVTPGPSDYATNTSLVNLKKASVFHGVSDRSMAVRNNSPGPAAYSPRMPNSSPRIRIKGSSTRESIQQTGEYVALKSTLTGPKYTISPRTNLLMSYG